MDGEFRSWRRGVERVSQRIFCGLVLFTLLSVSLALHRASGHWMTDLTIPSLVVLFVVLAWRAWRARMTWRDPLVFFAALVLVLVQWSALDSGVTGPDSYPGFSLYNLVLSASVIVSTSRRHLLLTVLALGTYASFRAGSEGPGGAMAALDEGVVVGATTAGIFMILATLRVAAQRADDAHGLAIRAASDLAEVSTRESALRDLQRTLHDDVIATLRFVELPLTGEARVAQVSACAKVAQSLTDGLGAVESMSVEASVLALSEILPIVVESDFDQNFHAVGLPNDVSTAFVRATGEALRNVATHAGAGRAEVFGRLHGDGGIEVEIRDQGSGFDVRGVGGFGVSNSIDAPLREVGGTTQISSELGLGTSVRLTWAPVDRDYPQSVPTGEDGFAVMRELIENLPRFLLALGLVLWSGHMYLALRYVLQGENVLRGLVAAVTVTALQAAIIWALAHNRASPRAVLAAFAVLAVVVGWGLSIAGDGALKSFDSWIVGMAEPPLIVLALVGTVRLALLAATEITVAVIAIAVADPTLRPFDVPGPIIESLLLAGIAAAAAAGVRRVRRSAVQAEISVATDAVAKIEVQVKRDSTKASMVFLNESVVPFLRSVASAQLDLDMPNVRDRARALCVQSRDELYFPGLIDNDIRTSLAKARAGGCSITIRQSEDLSAAAEAIHLLESVLHYAIGAVTIVVSVPTNDSEYSRVVVIPAINIAAEDDLRSSLSDSGIGMSSDESATVLTKVDTDTRPSIGRLMSSYER